MIEMEARLLSLELMEIAEVAILTNVEGDGFPRTRAMFNLRRKKQFPGLSGVFDLHQNDFLIYFTTNTSSSKIREIEKNPRVSVYYSLPSEWRGLMLKGFIERVEGEEKEAIWQDGWQMYYPGGVHDPDHTVLKLRPIAAVYYHQLHSITFNMPEEEA